MFTTVGFAESIDPAGALVNLAGIGDDTVFVSGDDVRVPTALPWLIGEAALISATLPIEAQFQSPTLRLIANVNVEPVDTGLVFSDPAGFALHPDNPIPLKGDEALSFLVNTNPAGAEVHYGFAWLGDGPQQPVSGNIVSIRATMSITAVADAWVNGALTFGQDLPVGNYDVVGMRARCAGGVLARLNFKGGAWRPGCPAVVAIDDTVGAPFRYGRLGVWGTFHTNTPPSVEIVAAAGAVTPTIILDVIPRG